nr:exonuclease subunit SbcD [Bacillus licheniformis]
MKKRGEAHMRILHTADWHLGKTLEGRSRLKEQEDFLEELARIVKDEKIDAVIMAGDAFDTVNPPALAEQLFYESLSALSDKGNRPVVVIAGNHDNPDRLSAASPLTTDHGIHLIGYPRTAPVDIEVASSGEILSVAALAYPSESRLNEVLSETFDEKPRATSMMRKSSRPFSVCATRRERTRCRLRQAISMWPAATRRIPSDRSKSEAHIRSPRKACRKTPHMWRSGIFIARRRSKGLARLPDIQAHRLPTAFPKRDTQNQSPLSKPHPVKRHHGKRSI